ncbi:MAG TPA: hypothetical protein DCS28_00080 [Candidatus Moranbacteria bacterium]|nr:hypothetical protein [Candidatus Moranbacteria bacterium]HAT74432.1 hypothetical protein [Candidatus Moranbacteria bacterium]
MKIGIDIRLIGKNQTGSEAVFFNLVRNLAMIDERNEYFLFTDIIDEQKIQKIKNNLDLSGKNNFKIISLKNKNKFSWNFWTLPKYLRKNPADIYLTQYITPFFVPRKIKILTIIHDVSFRVFPKLIKLSDLFFLRALIPISLRRADKIIAVSNFTRDEIIKYYKIKPEKVVCAYNAIADHFLMQSFSRDELEEIRRKYNLPQKFILYVGTLQPRKNIPILVEAYAKIKKQLPDVRLVLFEGNKYNYDIKIDQAIEKNLLNKEEIMHSGFIAEEDKKAVIQLADCFCYPSLYEGFGIPILEAFSCNVPCIVSKIPPHLEVAGNATLFFTPENSSELAEKISRILTNEHLRKKLIAKEHDQLALFSWKETAKKMMEIFEEM